MKKVLTSSAPVVLVLLALTPAMAQRAPNAQSDAPDLRREIQELRKGQQEIRNQLNRITKLLEASKGAPAPRGPKVSGTVFDLRQNPVKGAVTAKLTLVEFTDYQ